MSTEPIEIKDIKVAFIGNMNNNNFSLMRYLRDMGVDAHLLLMQNDFTKSQAHFAPEYDTFKIEEWKPYIHYLNYSSRYALFFRSKKKLLDDFKPYNILIGSGSIPAIMHKCGLKLDIFYPYGTGIEFVGTPVIRSGQKSLRFYKKMMYKYYRYVSIKGIKSSRICLNSELSLTKQTFEEIGVDFKKISIPMVYNKERNTNLIISDKIKNVLNDINKYRLKLFCHASHLPVKNKKPIIMGYKKFLERTKKRDSVLIFLDYGTAVEATKRFIEEAGITQNVLWLKKLSRKEIAYILSYISMGFSEFKGIMWGGTGWEFMSTGVPFFHYYNITVHDYEKEYGIPMPKFINTDSSEEICKHLINYSKNPQPYKKMGNELKYWFNNYGGKGLAEKYRDLIVQIYKDKRSNPNG